MGYKNSKIIQLKNYELNEYTNTTAFDAEQVKNIYTYFRAISSLEKDDGIIDYIEFCLALGIEDSMVAKRIFNVFDTNEDNTINFREFIMGISILTNDNIENQIKLSFMIFDVNKDGTIRASHMEEIINSCLKILQGIVIPPQIIHKIVNSTFEELNANTIKEDKMAIDFNQYRTMIRSNPQILSFLDVNLDNVKTGAQIILKKFK